MRRRGYTDEQFKEAVASSISWAKVGDKLGLVYAGGTVLSFKNLAKKLNLDLSHHKGAGWAKGISKYKRPLEKLLMKNVKVKSTSLKKRLIKSGLLKNECKLCNQGPIWNGKPLILHLDHIDGDPMNNELKNLRLLCPNCHTQTETYCKKDGALAHLGERIHGMDEAMGSNPICSIKEETMERNGQTIHFDENGDEYVLDENGNRQPPMQTSKKETSSGFTTYDSSDGHCGLCGNLSCNGSCFK